MERRRAELTTLKRGLEILTLVSEEASALGTSSIAERMEMSKSTAYNYIHTLERLGYLTRADNGRSFMLGPLAFQLTSQMRRGSTLVCAAAPLLRELVQKTNETVVLTKLIGAKAVCLAREESGHSLKLTYEIGTTYPLHVGASALALLAGLPVSEQKRLLGSLPLKGANAACNGVCMA